MATTRAQHLQEFEKFLTCPVCTNVITSTAKTLSCFHSFCSDCFPNHLETSGHNGQRYVCPECGSMEDLAQFNLMQNFVKLNNDSREETTNCYLCADVNEEESEAHWFCIVCKINLCRRCKSFHEKTPNCMTHQYRPCSEPVELIVDEIVYCSDHREQRIEEYCTRCNKGVCCKCNLQAHQNHPTASLSQVLSQLVNKMKSPIKSLKSAVQASRAEEAYFGREQNRINREYDSVRSSYEYTRDRLIAEINTQFANGISKLEEERKLNIRKVRTKITELCGRRKARQRLITTEAFVVKSSKGWSLLGGLFDRLLQKVTEYGRQDYTLQQVQVKQPVHLKGELFQGQDVCMGTISFRELQLSQVYPWLARHMQANMEHVLLGFNGRIEEHQLEGNPQRLAFVENDIWIPGYDPNAGFQVYNMINGSLKSYNNGVLRGIFAFTQSMRDEVIASCANGLFSLAADGVVKYKIADGVFTDIATIDKSLVAIEKQDGLKVKLFKEASTGWVLSSTIQPDRNYAYYESLHVLGDFIYLGFSNATIRKYRLNGQLVEEYGSEIGSGLIQFHDPYIAGSDSSKTLIICDSYNHRIKLKGPGERWQEVSLQGVFDYPKDIMVVRNQVFVLCGWFPKKLVTFSC